MKVRVFDTIAKGYHAVSMPDLIFYLERNSFFPRREDVEAILRRCDHDANRMISYAEFCELTCVTEPGQREQPQPAEAEGEQNAEDNAAEGEGEDDEAMQEGEFNDRVDELDQTDEMRQGPSEQKNSAEKNQNSA